MSGWGNVGQQRAFSTLRSIVNSGGLDSDIARALDSLPTTARADHPLVASFFSSFESDDAGIRRESISGLSDPHWWKQKVARWRGAATDAAIVGDGQVWLCAGGLRAAGESRDFYASFMESIHVHGSTQFLPQGEDRRLQAVEEKVARLEAWHDQLRLGVLVCVAECDVTGERRSFHVPAPAPAGVQAPLVHLVLELVRVGDEDDELVELLMTVRDQDHLRPHLVTDAIETARGLLEPVSDAWQVLPGIGTDQIWSVLVSRETLESARSAASDGEVPERLRQSNLTLGVQAHYIPKEKIVSASVEGDAVRGLCGRWFVPTSNPDALPVCPACEVMHQKLSG